MVFLCALVTFVVSDSFGEEIQESQNTTKTSQTNTKIPSQIDFTGILALLVIYYIPAQFIERMLEILKITTVPKDKKNLADYIFKRGLDKIRNKIYNLEAEIKFFQDIRKKINEKKMEKFGNDYIPNFSKENIEDWTKESLSTIKSKQIGIKAKKKLELDDFYELDTKKIDNLISVKLVLLSKAYQEQAVRVWVFSLAMAIIPAIIFAYYQIGLLQMLEISTLDGQIIDAIINTLFIGSGTKPIHDIMKKLSVTQKSILAK